jgi:predicted dehydrogenase
MITLGIVGIGKWGQILLKEFSKNSNIINCVSKGNSKNKKWLKKEYPKIKFSKKYDTILENTDIQGVIIATPIKTHFKLAYQALTAGKHVFVEKTISEKSIEGKKLLKLARKNNLEIFVGYEFLYHSIFQKLKNIDKNEKILELKCEWYKFGLFNENIFYDLVSHFISISIDLFGLPNEIKIIEKISITTKCDITRLELKYKNNKKVSIYINRVANSKRRIINIITEKNLYIWENEDLFKFKKSNNKKINLKYTSPIENESKQFLKEINKSKHDYTNAINAIDALKLIESER